MENKKSKITQKLQGFVKKYWLATLVFLLLIGWFYWFQWRPTQIQKSCYILVKNNTQVIIKSDWGKGYNIDKEENEDFRECLTRHGLKPYNLK